MAIAKYDKIHLGEGDLLTGFFSELSAGSAAPNNVNGSDGDVYIQRAVGNSNAWLKRGGVWVALIGAPFTLTLPDNATTTVASIPAAAAKYLKISYVIERASGTRSGTLVAVNDTSVANSSDYGMVGIGDDGGVDFAASISGSNLLIQATTTSTGSSASLVYKIDSWS